jgi:hypothetical protein
VAGITPDRHTTVQLVGLPLGEVLDERVVSLPATGSREIELRVPGSRVMFAGLVESAGGEPIENARVVMATAEGQLWGKTNQAGRFEVGPAGNVPVDVVIEAADAAVLLVPRFRWPARETPRFVLQAPHTVLISTVDTAGRTVSPTHASAIPEGVRLESMVEPWRGSFEADGVWQFVGLPRGVFEFSFRVGARTFQLVHDTGEPEGRLVIPAAGMVVVRFDAKGGTPGRLQAKLTSKGPESEFLVSELRMGSPPNEHLVFFTSVFPGEYTAVIEGLHGQGERWVPITQEKHIAVEASKTTQVAFSE